MNLVADINNNYLTKNVDCDSEMINSLIRNRAYSILAAISKTSRVLHDLVEKCFGPQKPLRDRLMLAAPLYFSEWEPTEFSEEEKKGREKFISFFKVPKGPVLTEALFQVLAHWLLFEGTFIFDGYSSFIPVSLFIRSFNILIRSFENQSLNDFHKLIQVAYEISCRPDRLKIFSTP